MSIIDEGFSKHIRVVVACHDDKSHRSDVMGRAKLVLMGLLAMVLFEVLLQLGAGESRFALKGPPNEYGKL